MEVLLSNDVNALEYGGGVTLPGELRGLYKSFLPNRYRFHYVLGLRSVCFGSDDATKNVVRLLEAAHSHVHGGAEVGPHVS